MITPRVLIDGTAISAGPDVVSVVGELVIDWGAESIMEEQPPATCSFSLRFAGAVNSDILQVGLRVDVVHEGMDRHTLFAGRIESMRANVDSRGRLVVNIRAADFMRDLRQTYREIDWAGEGATSPARISLINTALIEAGWNLYGWDRLPSPPPGAETRYNSITLHTILARWLAWWGPQVQMWDSSAIDSQGEKRRRIEIGWMGSEYAGDVLTTDPTGRWEINYAPPEGLATHIVPASSVLRDVEWTADQTNRYTGARVQYQTTRLEEQDDGTRKRVTSLDAVQTYSGAEVLERYGTRLIEIETSAAAPAAELRKVGQRWLTFGTGAWRMGAVTVHRASALPAVTLERLISVAGRRRSWWLIQGADGATPTGGRSTLRGVATGGRMTWTPGHGWDVTMHLTDTSPTVTTDYPWTFLLNAGDPRFSEAPATLAGDVTFADFQTITEMR